MADTSPAKICDVNQTVYATQVDEYTVRSDILNSSFKYLSFFEFGDNIFFLLFQFCFDESFVRNNDIFEFLVNFYHLEFHSFAHEYIVISNRFNIDLRTRQEGFDTEYINDHTAFGTAFDKPFNDFIVFKSRVNTIPRTGSTRFFVRKHQLAFFIFLTFNIHFDSVSDF